jgi:hypothetical protein
MYPILVFLLFSVGRSPDVEILERGVNGFTLRVVFPSPKIEDVVVDGKEFQRVIMEGTQENFEVGKPALPYFSRLIALPENKDPEVSILEMDKKVIEGVYIPYPHQPPPYRDVRASFVLDEEIYSGKFLYPEDWVKMGFPSIMRDVRLSPLFIYPVRWNPATSELIYIRSITLRVEYSKQAKKPKVRWSRGLTKSFIPLYKKLLNFSSLYSGRREISGSYLIVVYDDYYETLVPLKLWKIQRGIRTHLIKASEIATPLTFDELRNYIEDAYFNWSDPPEYVLLFGDADEIPPGIGIGGAITDHLYTTLEGDDYLPDLHIGRIPVNNVQEAELIVSKILMYERNPELIDTLWFRSGMTISGSDYVDDYNAMRCAGIMIEYGGFLHVDSLFQSNGQNTVTNVLNGLNEGRSWLVYFGHGFETGWSSVNPDFTNSHVYQLQNTKKLPVIVDIACSNGAFNYPGDCFAEAWLKAGSVGDERGAIGIFASTAPCAFFYTDTLGRGTFISYFIDSMFNYGAACDGGKFYMYQYFPEPPGGTTEETMQLFDAFGDPEIVLWSGVPDIPVVEFPDSIPIGYVQVPITVRTDDLTPIGGALVSLTQDTLILDAGYTDNTGQVVLNINALIPDPITITVTAHNHLPFVDTIIPSSEGPYVSPISYIVDDDTSGLSFGNGDSSINPGEIIELGLLVKNWGNATANAVSAILYPSDTSVNITVDSLYIGNLSPGDSLLAGDFVFDVVESLPDGYILSFGLKIFSSSGDTWNFNPSFTISSPLLSFENFTIVDSSGNGVIEPGETASLFVEIINRGHSIANQVEAILRTEDIHLFIIDSTSFYGSIPPDSVSVGDEFIVGALEVTPIHHEVPLTLIINAEGFQFVDTFTIVIGLGGDFLVYDPDPNHSSGPIIKGILDTLGFNGDYTTTLDDYIGILPYYDALFITLGIYPSNYVIPAGSQEAIAIEEYLTQHGGKVYMEGGDVWYWDPSHGGHNFNNLFGINPVSDGSGDLSTIDGISGTLSEGMSFTYSGENNFIDHIIPTGGAILIFQNLYPSYGCGVAYDAGNYKTVGVSFELAGLVDSDPPSTREDLVLAITAFFEFIPNVGEKTALAYAPRTYALYPPFPNPSYGKTTIRFSLPRDTELILKLYDVSGRALRTLIRGRIKAGVYLLSFDGRDDKGRILPNGVYLLRIDAGSYSRTRKLVILR